MRVFTEFDELTAATGEELGSSDWLEIDQAHHGLQIGPAYRARQYRRSARAQNPRRIERGRHAYRGATNRRAEQRSWVALACPHARRRAARLHAAAHV